MHAKCQMLQALPYKLSDIFTYLFYYISMQLLWKKTVYTNIECKRVSFSKHKRGVMCMRVVRNILRHFQYRTHYVSPPKMGFCIDSYQLSDVRCTKYDK